MPESATALQISQLYKQYGHFTALAPTDLNLSKGEFLALLGPSGAGKTTLLNLIAGMLQPDGGKIYIQGVDVTEHAPYQRNIGVVFQNYLLFPHMTVAENIAFPLKMRKVAPQDRQKAIAYVLELVQLSHLAARFPHELSGGQQQRIALARCIVYQPSIILMDEPLGALDKKLRVQMQHQIKQLHRALGATIIYVTHDQEEAMTLADRIGVIHGGRIEQLGSPADLYFRPQTAFAADFIGESNLLSAIVTEQTTEAVHFALNGIAGGQASGQAAAHGKCFPVGSYIKVMIRPQHLRITSDHRFISNRIEARLTDFVITGATSKLYFSVQAHSDKNIELIAAQLSQANQKYRPGEQYVLTWNTADAVAVPENPAVISLSE